MFDEGGWDLEDLIPGHSVASCDDLISVFPCVQGLAAQGSVSVTTSVIDILTLTGSGIRVTINLSTG